MGGQDLGKVLKSWAVQFLFLYDDEFDDKLVMIFVDESVVLRGGSKSRECWCHQSRNGQLNDQQIFVFADSTDAGTDQSARRRRTLAALAKANTPSVLFVDTNRMLHQYHIIVHQLLVQTDDFIAAAGAVFPAIFQGFKGYISSLCKCVNFWRENVSEFVQLWECIHGTHLLLE